MSESIEQLKKIIANAPEGATHCTDTVPSMNLYAKVEHLGGFYVRLSNRWEAYPIYAGIHLLDDLREIQRLRAENEALRNLCKQCADYLDINDLTNIAHGSIYHKELRKVEKEQSE